MLSRRTLLTAGGFLLAAPGAAAEGRRPRRVAAAATVLTQNSHAEIILGRLFQTETLDGRGRRPDLELAGLYVDQFPEQDLSRRLAREHGFRIFPSVQEALTLGGERLAVDGVLLVAEHGEYPHSEKGQELYPRKRFFDAAVEVFRRSGRAVPVFSDKHLSHSWGEAKAMVDTARELRFPLMAGSSLPVTWRRPALDVRRGARLREAVAISYHTLYGYGFHAMEMLQCLAERRRGGETGVRRVRCVEGPAVWEPGRFDRGLLDLALSRQARGAPPDLEKRVPLPSLFQIEYRDGFRASVVTLNGAVDEWAIAWREEGEPEPKSTRFWVQEVRPFSHFTPFVRGIEEMIHTGRSTWPVERTLLTSGMLDALLTSRQKDGAWVDTPELDVRYEPAWNWKEPGPFPG